MSWYCDTCQGYDRDVCRPGLDLRLERIGSGFPKDHPQDVLTPRLTLASLVGRDIEPYQTEVVEALSCGLGS